MRRLALLLVLVSTGSLAQGLPIKSGSSTTLMQLSGAGHAYADGFDSYGGTVRSNEDHLQVGQPTLQFYDPIEGSALNTNLWTGVSSTMAMAVAGGALVLNSAATTTAGSYIGVQTIRQFNLQGAEAPIRAAATIIKPTISGQSAQIVRFGLGALAASTTPTDGCWLEWNLAGEFRGYLATAGTTLQTAALTQPSAALTHSFYIDLKYDGCVFAIDDAIVASIEQGGTGAAPTAGKLPVFALAAAGVTPSNAPVLQIYQVTVLQLNIDMARDYRAQMTAVAGRGAYQSPTSTYAQTANHANSASPTSTTLSNTAAGYTTLGGRYQFAAVSGTSTDFALFGYQVPPGYQLHVLGISISSCVTGAAVTSTATLLDWGVAVNSSAVSLATTDALGPPPTAWGPKRVPLGMQGFPASSSAATPFQYGQIGSCAPDVTRTFDPPIVTDGGRFFHVILQVPVGTATASQVMRGDVVVNGWFE